MARREQLHALGVTSNHVSRQIAAQRWTQLSPCLLWLFTGPLPRRSQFWAAVSATPQTTVLGAWTGLEILGLTGWFRQEIHIVVPRGARENQLSGVVVHESRRLGTDDITYINGLPIHTIERCAVDAAAWQQSPRTAVGLLAAVVQQRLSTPDRILDQLDRVGQVRFRSLMRAAIADIRGGADALSEIDFTSLCRIHHLPLPHRQAPRIDMNGRRRYLDAEWHLPDGRRLIVEIDGIGHMEATRWYDDLLRDAELPKDTHTVMVRIPASAVRLEPERIVAILRRHLL